MSARGGIEPDIRRHIFRSKRRGCWYRFVMKKGEVVGLAS